MITNFKINKSFIVFVIISIAFLSLILFFIKTKVTSKMFPNVYIDKTNVGYMKKEDILKMYQEKNNHLNQLTLYVTYKNEPIGTFSAQLLNLHYNIDDITEKGYLVGRSSYKPSRYLQQFYTIFGLKKYDFQTQIEFDRTIVEDFTEDIRNSYNIQPKNALFKFENGRVTQFNEPKNGLKIQDTQFLYEVSEKIHQLKNTPSNEKIVIILHDQVLKPTIALAETNTYGIEELIGEGKSDFTHSIPERIFNLTLATSKFNGVIIPKNEIFSFADTVGDISHLTGYKPAYIIKGGRTVLGDGGGVCQVSTTLFRAALNAGLPIVERREHSYRVHYYEDDGSKAGLDATVFNPTEDLRFKNDTPAYILIQTKTDTTNMNLTFEFYGATD